LLKRGHSIIEAYFLGDYAILDAKHSRPREVHFAAGPCRQRTH
jgi:hypothetical protein